MRLCTLRFILIGAATVACGGPTTSPGDDDDPGADANVTLTVTARSLDPSAAPGVLYVYVGDAPQSRSSMPSLLLENAPTVVPISGASERTVTLTVPKGKVVTVFAVEPGRGGGFAVVHPTGLVKTAPTSATEFVGWLGPTQSQPETGVAVLTMDSNKTIIAHYDRMKGVTLRQSGCPALTYSWTGPAYLGFGVNQPNMGQQNPEPLIAFSDADADYVFAYVKRNSTVTFAASVRDTRLATSTKTGFMRWEGDAANCGTSLTCDVSIPANGATPAGITMVNSYMLGAFAPGSISCGTCDSPFGLCSSTLATMRP